MGLLDDAEAILGRTVAPGALDLLVSDLNARLRVREQEELYLTVPAPILPLPSFFIEAIDVQIDGGALEPTVLHMLRPGTFVIIADDIRLVDAGQLLTMIYRARIPPFEDGATNRVLTAYPALFLYGLLAHHATLIRDEAGTAQWAPRFEDALSQANANDARSRQSQISMRPVPRYCA